MTLSSTARLCISLRRPLVVKASRFLSRGQPSRQSLRSSSSSSSSDHKPAFDMAYGAVNPFQMNQYAIACTTTRQAALVDCGASSKQELDGFLKWISDHDYTLTAVWQTHAHLDHIAGLGMLTSMIEYAEIPIYLHSSEKDIYNNFEKRCRDFGFAVEGDGKIPEDTQLTFFDEESSPSLSLGELTFQVISTPGHSPGQVGFFEAKHTKSFLGGDFIMQGSIGRTDFPESSHADMEASLERFVKTMDDDTIIYPGHGAATTLKHEKQTNPYLTQFV